MKNTIENSLERELNNIFLAPKLQIQIYKKRRRLQQEIKNCEKIWMKAL